MERRYLNWVKGREIINETDVHMEEQVAILQGYHKEFGTLRANICPLETEKRGRK